MLMEDPRLKLRDTIWGLDIGPAGFLSMTSIFEIVVGSMLVVEMVKKLDIKPDAAVNFNWKCQAVHVALSPWRFYLDVKYEQGLRIAKMWFNS